MKNILLSGFMASGKTYCGKMLAEKFCKNFIDIDQEIEKKTSMNISAIFLQYGEEQFRKIETEIFFSIIKEKPADCIIAAGGGLVINPENFSGLKKCYNIFLNPDFSLIIQRLNKSKTKRPKVENLELKEIKKIFEERKEKYYHLADYTVNDCNEIIELMKNLKNMD